MQVSNRSGFKNGDDGEENRTIIHLHLHPAVELCSTFPFFFFFSAIFTGLMANLLFLFFICNLWNNYWSYGSLTWETVRTKLPLTSPIWRFHFPFTPCFVPTILAGWTSAISVEGASVTPNICLDYNHLIWPSFALVWPIQSVMAGFVLLMHHYTCNTSVLSLQLHGPQSRINLQ